MGWAAFFRYAVAVGGPVHVHVAAEVSGLTPATIRARAEREGWWRPFRDVVVPPGLTPSGRRWALAALARLHGPDRSAPRPAALTRWSAAAWYGVRPSWPTRVEVLVPHDRGAVRPDRRLRLVRTRTWAPDEVGALAGACVVAPARLVQDLAAVTSVPGLTPIVIDLVQQRAATFEELSAGHERRPRYPGRAIVGEVLDRLRGAGRTDSPPELLLRERLVAAGVPLDPGQVEVPCRDGRSLHLDLGIARIRFGIEVQSMLAHAARHHLLADVARHNRLTQVDDDWRVLQATYEDLEGDAGEALVRAVTEVVSAQSRRHLGVPWPTPARGPVGGHRA